MVTLLPLAWKTPSTMQLLVWATLYSSLNIAAWAFNSQVVFRGIESATKLHESKNDIVALAKQLNPVVGYFDPLGITENSFWGFSKERTIGWLRHSEIKHGRVAQAAFVGYCVQSFVHWPWAMTLDGTPFPSTNLSPPEQWDSLPLAAKLQIILFVGFLEFYSELTPGNGTPGGLVHYTKGGQPGKFPTFDEIPHPVLNLYDPFGFSKNMTDQTKERRLRAEINNGRLAMLGIMYVSLLLIRLPMFCCCRSSVSPWSMFFSLFMLLCGSGFLSEQKMPGSVPLLTNLVKPYAGEVMAPFEGNLFL